MTTMSLIRLITTGVLALSLAPIAHAKQAGIKLSEKVTQSSTIDPAARAEITKFIAQSVKNLKSDDPMTVRTGREMVVNALTKQQVHAAFRPLFASMILPDLTKVIASSSAFQATNALEIVKALQCPDSITLLAEQSAPKNQPNASLRLIAAGGLATMRTPIELTIGQADGVLKVIGSSIAKETDWMVASYDLQALQAFSTSPQVPKASQAMARTLLLTTLNMLVSQIRTGTIESGMIRAVNRSLALYMRDQVPLANAADVSAFMKALEPTLKEIKILASSPPDTKYPDAYAQAGKIADTIMKNFLAGTSGGKPANTKPAGKK